MDMIDEFIACGVNRVIIGSAAITNRQFLNKQLRSTVKKLLFQLMPETGWWQQMDGQKRAT